MNMPGFNVRTGKITILDGALSLIDSNDTIAAFSSLKGMMARGAARFG